MYLQEPPHGDGASGSVQFLFLIMRTHPDKRSRHHPNEARLAKRLTYCIDHLTLYSLLLYPPSLSKTSLTFFI